MTAGAGAHEPAPRPRTAGELAARLVAERGGAPFLLYRAADDEQRILVLGTGSARLSIGREPANDLPLVWDQEVSRVHAELERIAGEWAVVDDGLSRNGTFVNGRRVSGRRRLRDGDCIRVGRTLLAFTAPVTDNSGATVGAPAGAPIADELTATQRRILAALCRPLVEAGGLAPPASNREIAATVHLSVEGVKGQLRTLAERFGLADLPQNRKRLELAERALAAGLGAPIGD